jgi:hypothetical protein
MLLVSVREVVTVQPFEGDFEFTGEDATMFCIGAQRLLTGYRNRLWTTQRNGELRFYPHEGWPWNAENLIFSFHFDACACSPGWSYLNILYESDTNVAKHGPSMRKGCWGFRMLEVTSKLILLQRWFCNVRRKARRLALAIALHPRLGNGSLLSIMDTELARTLMLSAT